MYNQGTTMTTFTTEDLHSAMKKISPATEVVNHAQLVREAPYHPGYEDAVVDSEYGRPLSQVIRDSMRATGKRFWDSDSILEGKMYRMNSRDGSWEICTPPTMKRTPTDLQIKSESKPEVK